jgi:hypothetical protein
MVKYTNQSAFDKMCKHLWSMKKRAYCLDTDNCVYRTKDGNRCAVGCLIEDEDYSESLENQTASDVARVIPYLSNLDYIMLDDMQRVHDIGYLWTEEGVDKVKMYQELQNIADFHGLKLNIKP